MSVAREISFSRPASDELVIHLSGSWKLAEGLPSTESVRAEVEVGDSLRRVAFDTQSVSDWDTALPIFLHRLLEQLVSVSSDIVDALDGALLAAQVGQPVGLAPGEANAFTWLLHPFGATESRGHKATLPTWVIEAGLAVSKPTQLVAPPALYLAQSPSNAGPGKLTARGVAAAHRRLYDA